MRTKPFIRPAFALVGALFTLAIGASAQVGGGMNSKQALAELAARYGDDVLSKLVAVQGYEGVPEPDTWEVVTHDPRSPRLLHRYRIGPGYVRDEGGVDDRYPAREPSGFIDFSQLQLSSQGAFTIAEAAARQARMGFDSLNYTLRCREYSREPVWILHLIDAEGLLVGKVHISANSARVFRTVWIYRDEDDDDEFTIVDSALTPPAPVAPGTPSLPGTSAPGPSTTQVPPTAPATGAPPASIRVDPGTPFVPPAPQPRTPLPTTNGREPVPSTGLPPIPPELLQTPDTPDTTIPPPPVRQADGD